MNVHDNLRLGADGLPAAEVKARLDLILSYFPLLAARLGQRSGTLSGGEAQMLGVARRLMRLIGIPGKRAIQEPRLLIIDEPSLGLAPEFTQRVLATVSRIRRDHGVSIVLIEEGPSRLMGWVDRACVLNRGVIIAEGSLLELSQNAIVNEALGGGVEIDHADSPPQDGSSLDLD